MCQCWHTFWKINLRTCRRAEKTARAELTWQIVCWPQGWWGTVNREGKKSRDGIYKTKISTSTTSHANTKTALLTSSPHPNELLSPVSVNLKAVPDWKLIHNKLRGTRVLWSASRSVWAILYRDSIYIHNPVSLEGHTRCLVISGVLISCCGLQPFLPILVWSIYVMFILLWLPSLTHTDADQQTFGYWLYRGRTWTHDSHVIKHMFYMQMLNLHNFKIMLFLPVRGEQVKTFQIKTFESVSS